MRQEVDLEKIKRTHAALYRPGDLVPADGDDMTWDEQQPTTTISQGDHYQWLTEQVRQMPEIWTLLHKLQAELATLRKRMDEYEGEL